MFSITQKRALSILVQDALRATEHPELPAGEIAFVLHVQGEASWSFARIQNNGAVETPSCNPWNERQDPTNR